MDSALWLTLWLALAGVISAVALRADRSKAEMVSEGEPTPALGLPAIVTMALLAVGLISMAFPSNLVQSAAGVIHLILG